MSFDVLVSALWVIVQPQVLIVVLLASIYGLFIGAIPGLSATMATALLIPLTYYMDPVAAIAAIVATTAMAITAGDIPGVLLRIPGTPASAAYVEEAYALNLKGKAQLAMGIGIVFSAAGGLVGAAVLLLSAPILARASLSFSSFEFFWMALLGLLTSALVSTNAPARGLFSLCLGLLISTVGLDVTSGQPRFTFGVIDLYGGVSFIPTMIGMFAFAELLRGLSAAGTIPPVPEKGSFWSNSFAGVWGMFRKYPWSFIRGSALGSAVGALPGIGGDLAAWISYGMSKRFSRTPEKFGTGHEEGLVEASSSNNAGLSSAWVPALVFGIPGDAVTAIAIGVLFMKGLNPGPQLFVDSPTMLTAVILTFGLANLLLLPIGYFAIKGARYVLSIPRSLIVPTILVFCVVGSFAINNTLFDIGVMLAAGLVAYVLEANRFPLAPVILGLVLGPILERNFIMSMQIADGNLLGFFSRPVAAGLGVIVCAVILIPLVRTLIRIISRRRPQSRQPDISSST
ncbi:tripartite tricarboxylate transporter permease [Pelagibacterium sp. 26DY04]|uniref:tripartite tricarboxylate transporter permease n=1 Tax=Pelagibacterium sp. 26DY04 TaxID=2967130 RepID=UPI0028158C4E|nr:tripartite tricarboxylate transporter permease [Pelagibacterium sp. 26DY04]WMT87690.1 tripartite tricarboxylate transporter permease [Pelagibacterium sp. 26DY04]